MWHKTDNWLQTNINYEIVLDIHPLFKLESLKMVEDKASWKQFTLAQLWNHFMPNITFQICPILKEVYDFMN